MTDTEPPAPTPDTPPPATPQSATPQQAPKQQPAVQRLYRTATRGEAVAGMAWLCLGAIISMFLEVIYLGTWMFGVAVPYTIPIAFCFNMVLTRTGWAGLYSSHSHFHSPATNSSVRISAVYYLWWPGP